MINNFCKDVKIYTKITFTSIFVLILVYFIISRYNYKLLYYNNRLDTIISEETLNRLIDNTGRQLNAENTILNDFLISDMQNSTLKLSEILDSTKLLYRFFPQTCPPCLERDLDSLKVIGEEIGFNNIIIISSFEEPRLLKVLMQSKSVDYMAFNIRNSITSSLEYNNKSKPYLLIITKDRNVVLPFVLNDDPNVNSLYYARVKKYFLN